MLTRNLLCGGSRAVTSDVGGAFALSQTACRLSCAQWLGIVFVLGGCVSTGRNAGPVDLVASPRPYEADIPLPEGFVLAERSSEDWSSGSIRYMRHRYVGRADKYALRMFYREQMPLVRWSAVADSNVNGVYTLRFMRGEESCTIVVADSGSLLVPRVAVEVMICPTAGSE